MRTNTWMVILALPLITALHSFSQTQPGNRSNTDQGDIRPDRISEGELGSGRDTIQGPGLADFHLSVAKDFAVQENKRQQFRSEFLNLSNTPYFGKVTSLARGGTANTLIVQFALNFLF